jgi:formylglycine-generating enzyme required for sulfatase activity
VEEQVPPSQQLPLAQVTPEQLQEMKAIARERALAQTIAQQQEKQVEQLRSTPQVVYVRRNPTIAELLVLIVVCCGIITGVQWTWNTASSLLPRIEIKVK